MTFQAATGRSLDAQPRPAGRGLKTQVRFSALSDVFGGMLDI